MNNFLNGFGSIDLFPDTKKNKSRNLNFTILSDEEAFKMDLEYVGKDMWNAIDEIQNKASQ